MKIQKFGTAVASALLFASVVLTACGQKAPNESSAGGKDASGAALYSHLSKPVTIVFQSAYNETTAESVEQTMFKRIREKFPNVNPVYIQRGKGSTIQDLIVAGNVPDILWGNLSTVNEMVVNTGLSYDLSPLVKQFNLDLGIFPQAALDAIKNTNEKGELLGLPKNNLKPSVLFYNKDIFDKFGVPYPRTG